MQILKKITEIEDIDRHSLLVFLNHPDDDEILAMALFSDTLVVETENGKPKLNENLFESLPKKQKLKEIKSIVSTIASLMKSVSEIYSDLGRFGEKLIDIEADILGKKFVKQINDAKTMPPQPTGEYIEQIFPSREQARYLMASLKNVTKSGKGGFVSDDKKVVAKRESCFVIKDVDGIPRTSGKLSRNAVRVEWRIEDEPIKIYYFWAETWKGWRRLQQRVREQLRGIIKQ